jgi:hypothetical protein
MERVHHLLAQGDLDAEDDVFWAQHWYHIASAKVPLETKIAAYRALKLRNAANSNDIWVMNLCDMVLADRAFVGVLDLNIYNQHCYRVISMWLDDDVAALASYYPSTTADKLILRTNTKVTQDPENFLRYALMKVNAPRCIRFLLQDKAFREWVLPVRMSPLVQRIAEELVQPTDCIDKDSLLEYGQSVKLIGMFVRDEELVATWLTRLTKYQLLARSGVSLMLVRKLYVLATPEQRARLEYETVQAISAGVSNDSCFEFAWLFGLLGPWQPKIQEKFRKGNVGLFPAFTFAMIVAMCDGYLKLERGIPKPQARFFNLVVRLPMDLQALVSLRLWGHATTVIQGEKFDRAFLTIL